MNAQGQSHLPGSFQGGMPSQQQNTSIPRSGTNTSQTATKQPNNQGARGQYALPNEHLLDPQLSLWTITKPTHGMSWEESIPEQLCVSKQDVEQRMAKFRRKGEDVTETLMRIKSTAARKAINNLVVEQNENLWVYNPTIRYYIASIQLDMEVIKSWPDKGKKRLRRIDVILRTEPRPLHEIPKSFLDAMQPPKPKDPYSSQGGPGQQGSPSQKGNQPQGQGQGQGQGQNQYNNPQSQGSRPTQGQGPNNGQYQNQNYNQPQGQNMAQTAGTRGGQPPPPPPPMSQGMPPRPQGMPSSQIPPPPPPVNMQPNHPQNIPPPPPPPTGPTRQPQQVNNIPPPPPPMAGPPRQPQQANAQPTYTGNIPPPPPMMPQQVPPMPGAFPGTMDPRILEAQKAKPKGSRREARDYSDSDTGSFSDVSVEGGYGYVERSRSRGRGRNDHRRSRSRSQLRSRSRGRDGGILKSYKDKRAHGRTRSDIESPPRERHNASPNASNPALPHQNIFNIKIDNDKERAKTKNRDGHRRTRDQRRANHSTSPPGFLPGSYKGQDKYAAEAMYRSSSNNGSDSESSYADSSSLYTPSDPSVFDEPDRHFGKPMPIPTRPPYMQHRDDGFGEPNFDYERRASTRNYYTGANDYPPRRAANRSPQFDDHIMPPTSPRSRPAQAHRRHGQQNPFDTGARYAGGYGSYAQDQPLPQYLDRERDQARLDELADVMLEKMGRRPGMFGRRGSTRVPLGGLGIDADTDEWSNRADKYGRDQHPRYSGFRHG